MGKAIYIGVSGTARKVKNMYIGVGGVARKVKKAYIGVGGVARCFWAGGQPVLYGSVGGITYTNSKLACSASNGTYAVVSGGNDQDPSALVQAYNSSLTRSQATSLSYSAGFKNASSNSSYALIGGGAYSWDEGDDNYTTSYATVNAYNTSLTRSIASSLSTSGVRMLPCDTGTYAMFAGGRYGSRTSSASISIYNTSLTKSTASLSSAKYRGVSGAVGSYAIFAGGYYYDGDYNYTVDSVNSSLTVSALTNLSYYCTYGVGATAGNYALLCKNDLMLAYNSSLTLTTMTNSALCGEYAGATSLGDHALFGVGTTVYVYDSSLTMTSHTVDYDVYSHTEGPYMSFTVGDYAVLGEPSTDNFNVFTA